MSEAGVPTINDMSDWPINSLVMQRPQHWKPSPLALSLEPVLVTREEAAWAMGMSLDSFERYVQAEIRLVRRGRLRLVPVSELRKWAEANAEGTLD